MNLGISLGFLLLAAVFLWTLIGSKGKWIFKSIFIVILSFYCVVTFLSLRTYMGWASSSSLPKEFLLHWAVAKPPSSFDDESNGYIGLFLENKNEDSAMSRMTVGFSEHSFTNEIPSLFVYVPDNFEPRLYKIPYSRQTHKAVANIQKEIVKGGGKPIHGKLKGKNKGGQDGDGGGKKGKGDSGFPYSEDFDIEFHKLPPSKNPSKTPNSIPNSPSNPTPPPSNLNPFQGLSPTPLPPLRPSPPQSGGMMRAE